MKNTLKWLALIAVTLFLLCFASALAETSGTCGDNLRWILDDQGTLEIFGEGPMTDYGENNTPWPKTIKKVIIHEGVTSVGTYAFYRCNNLTSIVIPEGVTSLGCEMCAQCHNLTSATIPNSVTSIGFSVFSECWVLKGDFTIPEGVTEIGMYSFNACQNVSSIMLPEGVISIGEYAFYRCTKFTSFTIPKSTTCIEEYAFSSCSNLKDVFYKGSIEDRKRISISSNNASLTNATWHYVQPSSGTCGLNLTWTLDDQGTLTIKGTGEMADYNCDTPIYSPWGTGIKAVIIKSGVTSIGDCAFDHCSGLTSVSIADSVTSIGWYGFHGCINLTSIEIPNSVTTIKYGAFEECNRLINVEMSERLTKFDDYLFKNCYALSSIAIPDAVTSIGRAAFEGCKSLTHVRITVGVPTIGDWTFKNCIGLTSISIPLSVTNIGKEAFYNCSKLTDVYYTGTIDDRNRISISSNNSSLTNATWHYVQPSSGTCGANLTWLLDAEGTLIISGKGAMWDYSYEGAPWNGSRSLITSVVISNGVSNIGRYAFLRCTNLKNVSISPTVTTICGSAFEECGFSSIVIPDTVNEIDNWAFARCSNLTDIVLPKGLTKIDDSLFRYCDKLASIIIPDRVTRIYGYAFDNCQSLISVKIPVSVTSIGNYAFCNCNKLTDIFYTGSKVDRSYISISDNNGPLSNAVWHYFPVMSFLKLPADLTIIYDEAFMGIACEGVIIPDGCSTIGSRAFANCPNLIYIKIPASVTKIANDAFDGSIKVIIDREK